jgi:hypothetical protein
MLECTGVCRGVWPRRAGKLKGVVVWTHNRGGNLYGGMAKGVAGRVGSGLLGAGEGGGGNVWVWMCRISLGVVGLRYETVKWGRLRCGGLDTVEGLHKTVFWQIYFGGKEGFIFQNARCKESMRKLFLPRDGLHLSRLFVIPWPCHRCLGTPGSLPSQVRSSRPQEDLDCPRGVLLPTGLVHFQGVSPLRGIPR